MDVNSAPADFYLGTGPDARWLGSLAEFDGPADGPPPTASAEDQAAQASRQVCDCCSRRSATVHNDPRPETRTGVPSRHSPSASFVIDRRKGTQVMSLVLTARDVPEIRAGMASWARDPGVSVT